MSKKCLSYWVASDKFIYTGSPIYDVMLSTIVMIPSLLRASGKLPVLNGESLRLPNVRCSKLNK